MKKILISTLTFLSLQVNAQQIVSMKSGEKMNGKVQSLKEGMIDFLYKGNLMKISTNDIYSITFGEMGESAGDRKSVV